MIAAKEKSQAELVLAALFEQRKGDGAPDLREEAWAAFSLKGLPNRRLESWHYTDLRAALREIAPEAGRLGAVAPAQDDRLRIAIAGGEYAARPEDLAAAPEGVTVTSLRAALAQGDAEAIAALAPRTGDPAVDLNAALMQDGAVLRIAPGARIERPISLDSMPAAGASTFTRNLVLVGEGAKTTIIEAAAPLFDGGQENHALVLNLGAGAVVELIGDFGFGQPDTVRVYSLLASLAQDSVLKSTAFVWGGGLLRRQIFATLEGERAQASFNGVALLAERAHADTTLQVRHEAPNGKSRERFRTIVDDDASGVFQGKASVAREAQKTDGAMQSKALLLSPGASMSNKPELEIFADDVICGHGATCGRLEAEQLFYLMARGIPRNEAEALLIEGFANEALEQIETETLRAELADKVSAWLRLRGRRAKESAQ